LIFILLLVVCCRADELSAAVMNGTSMGEDTPLGQVLSQFLEDDSENSNTREKFDILANPIHRNLFDWHCANIEYSSSADVNNLSVRFWAVDDQTAFEGDHCVLKQGYSALAKSLAENTNIRYNCEVTQIHHDANDGCKIILSNGEELTADIVLVTVPLGILKKDRLKFDPPLPEWKQSAIHRMGYGVLNKVTVGMELIEF
jgi:lysine-specific histone demethylase 1